MEAGVYCRHVSNCCIMWRSHRDSLYERLKEENLSLLLIYTYCSTKHRTCCWVRFTEMLSIKYVPAVIHASVQIFNLWRNIWTYVHKHTCACTPDMGSIPFGQFQCKFHIKFINSSSIFYLIGVVICEYLLSRIVMEENFVIKKLNSKINLEIDFL